ncbi:MAG: carbonic anhydrase [Alcanivorax sp.]|jgi:carbonic anhydrase
MSGLDDLFANNRTWVEQAKTDDPEFFKKLANQQSPEYLWIGCSDSRVPANQIVGLPPGGIFVHRNVGNVVAHSDLNCLTVLQYAVDVLRVKHIIVVGHYGCGGVKAAYEDGDNGLIDNWLRNIKDVLSEHRHHVNALPDTEARLDLLCELNVQRQVANVCHTTIAQKAWARGQQLSVYGLVYSLKDGLLKDLGCTVDSASDISEAYRVSSSDA